MLCTLYVEWWSDTSKITLQTGQTLAPFHAPPSPKRKIFCLKDEDKISGREGRPAAQPGSSSCGSLALCHLQLQTTAVCGLEFVLIG
jgi:hypothetical protein